MMELFYLGLAVGAIGQAIAFNIIFYWKHGTFDYEAVKKDKKENFGI